PSRRVETAPDDPREPRVLAPALARRRRYRRRARHRRHRQPRPSPRLVALRRAETARGFGPASDPHPAGMAPRRTGDFARHGRRGNARAPHREPPRRRRHGDGGPASAAADRADAVDRPGEGGMIAAFGTIAAQTARLSLRGGGG